MKLAILFWFYKEPEICVNRLELIKKHNPNVPIYGLYGGDLSQASAYQEQLGAYLDDFYAFEQGKAPEWKWIHGDLVLLDWYEKRAAQLDFDSVAVIQWDMLVCDSLEQQFAGMKAGEAFFSGLRELDPALEQEWHWTMPETPERQDYLNFLAYAKEKYGYADERPLCCLYILVILPRIFFEKYLQVPDRELGMLEYKDPVYAKLFGIPFFQKEVGVLWHDSDQQQPMNAVPTEIPEAYIAEELAKPDGYRLFHPYFKTWR